MNLFKKKYIDERIENTLNRIYKEAYILSIVICVVSVVVKYYLYGIDTKLVIAEILIIIIPAIYYLVKTVWLGVYLGEMEIHDRRSKIPMSVKNVLIGLGSGIVIAVFFGVRSSIVYGSDGNRLWYFILVFFTSLIIYCPFFAVIIFAVDSIAKKVGKRASLKDQE